MRTFAVNLISKQHPCSRCAVIHPNESTIAQGRWTEDTRKKWIRSSRFADISEGDIDFDCADEEMLSV